MKLSSRVRALRESATLAISQRAGELRRSGVDVVNWSAGEPDFSSPPSAVEAARQALAEGRTRYTANAGIPELRSAIASDLATRYSAPWEGDQVLVTVGAKAALFELSLALFEDGDEVVLPSPSWVSFPAQITLAGAKVVPVQLDPNDGFRVSRSLIEDRISDRTRAVLLNSPSNPTGAIIEGSDLRGVVELCAEHDISLIADETYERFIFDGKRHASAATLAREFPQSVILVGSFSKVHAMTGWRIGFLAGPSEVVAAAAKIQSHATSNATTFAMWGALAALADVEERVPAMVAEYQARRDLLLAGLNRISGIQCPSPGGAFYAFPRVSDRFERGRDGSDEFARFLLDQARIAVVPGNAFGADEHIRISFACSRERLSEGLDRFTQAMA